MCLTDATLMSRSVRTPHSMPSSPPTRRRSRRWWLALCVVGVVLGLLIISLAVLDAVPATGSPAVPPGAEQPVPRGGYRWPLDGNPRVTRPFNAPPEPWAAGHRGVDLAGRPGAPVRAAAAGVVHFAGTVVDRGVVSIRHTAGLRTTYEPVTPLVTVGQTVRAGDIIGTLAVGHAGCPVTACLHWGLRRGDQYLDPLAMLGLGRVRLLPITYQPPAAPQAASPQALSPTGSRAGWFPPETSGARMRLTVDLPQAFY